MANYVGGKTIKISAKIFHIAKGRPNVHTYALSTVNTFHLIIKYFRFLPILSKSTLDRKQAKSIEIICPKFVIF